MMKLAELLLPQTDSMWHLARQSGVTHAVSRLPMDNRGQLSWDFMDLLQLKNRFSDSGLKLEVIEPGLDSQMHNMKLGIEGRDKDIEQCKMLIRNMGALEIPVLCYNFMARFNWVRTSVSTVSRGGAIVTSYDHRQMKDAPLTEAGIVSQERLWDNLKYFMEAVLPVAEEAKVKLALHPDDPPVSSIRGISRIITSCAAMKKVIDLFPSRYNGITLCQGSLAAAGEDIPAMIREFGRQNKIFFVHFRDIRGKAEEFFETFHDDGQTNMYEAIKAYKEVGFDGPVRIDHVPTMYGEDNNEPGYSEIGRLFAIGYLKGLLESRDKFDERLKTVAD
jgi:mannonate dehydratase